MAQSERRQRETVTMELADPTDAWLTSPPYSYHIIGYEFDGEFALGFRCLDATPAHPDVLPEQTYQAITRRLRAALDLDRVQAEATADSAPTVGRCTITNQDGGRLDATIKLVDRFLSSEP